MWTRLGLLLACCLVCNGASGAENRFSSTQIVGTWRQLNSGRELTVQPGANGSFDVRLTPGDWGTLVGTTHAGADVRFRAGRLDCYYSIAVSDAGQTLQLDLKDGDPTCFKGTFSRAAISSPADDAKEEMDSLDSMIGRWKNSSGETEILKGDDGLTMTRKGFSPAKLSWSIEYQSNAQLHSSDLDCYYFVTFDTTRQTMRWVKRAGAAACPEGVFARTSVRPTAQGLGVLERTAGDWVHLASGQQFRFTEAPNKSLTVSVDVNPFGIAEATAEDGGNIKVVTPKGNCVYYGTFLTGGQRLNLALRKGDDFCKSLSGQLARAEH